MCNPYQFACQLGLGPGFWWSSVQATCLYSFRGQELPGHIHIPLFLVENKALCSKTNILKPQFLLFSTKISLAKIDHMSKPDAYVTRRHSISLQSRDLKTQNSRLENWTAIHMLCWHGISDCLIFYKV